MVDRELGRCGISLSHSIMAAVLQGAEALCCPIANSAVLFKSKISSGLVDADLLCRGLFDVGHSCYGVS